MIKCPRESQVADGKTQLSLKKQETKAAHLSGLNPYDPVGRFSTLHANNEELIIA